MNLVDYHIHTTFCGHATGTIDEYITSALHSGLREIGFSDHAPLPAPFQEGITMLPGEAETYISEIEKRKAGCSVIAVKLGFEVDFPLHPTFERKYLTDTRIDYLIGSCHMLDGWLFDHPDHLSEWSRRDVDKVYDDYFRVIRSLVQSDYFNIVGHFDLVKKFGHRAAGDFGESIRSIGREMAKRGIAVEINTSGLQKPVAEIYPSEAIINILFEANVPVTLGSDSHSPDMVAANFAEAVEILQNAGYRTISGFSGRKRYNITL